MKPVQVRTGSTPFEMAAFAAAATAGAVLVVAGHAPRSVDAAMPGTVQVIWQVQLIAGGLLGLAGVLWRGRLTAGLGIEMAGAVVLAAATSMYSIALYTVSGLAAAAAGTFITGIAVAAWSRAVQILRDLRRVAAAARRGQVADVPLLVEESS